MKKTLLIIILTAILSLSACSSPFNTDEQEASRIEELETKVAEYEKKLRESEETADRIDDYEKRLNAAENTAAEWQYRYDEAEKANEKLRAFRTYDIKDGKIYYYKNSNIVAVYDDGQIEEVHDFEGGLASVDMSPDGRKLLISDFDLEGGFYLYIYYVNEGRKEEIQIKIPEKDHSPSHICWLDDRYFLFVEQFDHGTVTFGGTVYYYDTKTEKSAQVIDADINVLQIAAVDLLDRKSLYGFFDATMLALFSDEKDTFLVSCAVVERGNFVSDRYFLISKDEIAGAIANGTKIALN